MAYDGFMNPKNQAYPVTNPPPLPIATLEDVKGTIRGLAPGIYLSSDLYQRYGALMKEQGREPVAPQTLGRMFTQFGLLRRQRRGSNAWLIQ